MGELRFAAFGAGFWAGYQLAGWQELEGVRCVALYNRTRTKAEKLAAEHGIQTVYEDPEESIRQSKPDFIDIITDVDSHHPLVLLAARHGIPVVCQKPMAPSLEKAREMVSACKGAGIPFFVHENWRWQRPLRELKMALDSGRIGRVFRARIDYCNSFPVFENQPFLKELDQFILTDIGTHILDVARFLFGEARSVYCRTHRVHRDIKGEDVATVVMPTEGGVTTTCNMSYASRLEHDRFPETFVLVEADNGSIELGPDYWLRVTTGGITESRRVPPPFYPWADPRYGLVQSAIVDCNRDLLSALRSGSLPETHAEDNLKTLQLVYAAYESAQTEKVVSI